VGRGVVVRLQWLMSLAKGSTQLRVLRAQIVHKFLKGENSFILLRSMGRGLRMTG